jgi:hypothetical protein
MLFATLDSLPFLERESHLRNIYKENVASGNGVNSGPVNLCSSNMFFTLCVTTRRPPLSVVKKSLPSYSSSQEINSFTLFNYGNTVLGKNMELNVNNHNLSLDQVSVCQQNPGFLDAYYTFLS